MNRRELPIFEIEEKLASAFVSFSSGDAPIRIIIEAPAGSGKSTQVPQILLDRELTGSGEIFVLQPRRIAARMLARRVAWERGQRCGEEVGFQVRFEEALSSRTKIRYVTEGILLRRLLSSPDLDGIDVVVFDEFHERSFFGDVSLARCLQIQETVRPGLRIVVMSATMEAKPLQEYLGKDCVHLQSEGRIYPVEVVWQPPKRRRRDKVWDLAARALRDHYRSHPASGHALVFMPGRYEIRKTAEAIRRASWSKAFQILELHGELSPENQDLATATSDVPKIVIATNLAETSITIDGVELVVDSGLERRASFDSRRGISTLHIVKISQASAGQRAGRAGRTSQGKVIRLWSENDHATRDPSTPPEILRMDLSEAVLLLKASRAGKIADFRWFEPPRSDELQRAVAWLQLIGALDEEEELTPAGAEMSRLPVAPRWGRILVEAAGRGCLEFFAIVAAGMQSRPFFLNRTGQGKRLGRSDYLESCDVSDFEALVRAFHRAKAARFDRSQLDEWGLHAGAGRDINRISRQLVEAGRRMFPGQPQDRRPPGDEISKIALTGLPDRIAIRNSKASLACRVTGNRRGSLEKQSAVSGAAGPFAAAEIVEVEGKEVQVKLDWCTAVSGELLAAALPESISLHDGGTFDPASRRIESRVEKRFLDLVISSKRGGEVPDGEAADLLAAEVASGNLVLKRWDQKVETYVARVNLLAETFPEYEAPPIDDEARQLLLVQICEGARSYKEIKDRDVMGSVASWLPAHLRPLLDTHFPERIELREGKSARVFYTEASPPKISVMIQDLFGIEESPRIAEGRIALVVEILAPNRRPVQVTEDLAGFWKGSYAGVRAQLRGRYPKHDWPDPEGFS